jgi:VanZ family protein
MTIIKQFIQKNAFLIAAAFTTITIVGSLMPAGSLGSENFVKIPQLDKIVHFIMYMCLGFSWNNVLRHHSKSELKSIFILFVLGFCLEMIQFYFLEGRFFEIPDLIANITGSIVGIFVYNNWTRVST